MIERRVTSMQRRRHGMAYGPVWYYVQERHIFAGQKPPSGWRRVTLNFRERADARREMTERAEAGK